MSINIDLGDLYEHAACGLVSTTSDGTIVNVNQTFCTWLGYSREALVCTTRVQDLLTVGARFFHQTHWTPLIQLQGRVTELQLDLRDANGEVRPMLINAIRRTVEGQTLDQLAFITANDRKSYEQELRTTSRSLEASLNSLRETKRELQQSNEFLRVAMRSARLGVWAYHLPSEHISISPELQSLLELTDEQQWDTQQAFGSLIHPDDREKFLAAMCSVVNNHDEYDIVFRIKHPRKEWLIMEGRGHGNYDEQGRIESIFGIFTDVTKQKDSERQLLELNAQLTAADKRKDAFLATLGHELRNPLAPIQNVLEVLKSNKNDPSYIDNAHQIINRHISQMTHLVDDLLEASRISRGQLILRKQRVDMKSLVNTAIEATQPFIAANDHTLSVNMPSVPVEVDADPTRIIQVLSNLLSNAAKYTPSGGEVRLDMHHDGQQVVVKVQDSGIGIPQQELSNVFSMFSQLTPALERAQGGLGIGLSLAKELVELHDGHISAHSEGKDKGSEFTLILPSPTSKNTRAVPVPPSSDVQSVTLAPMRILVIDDSVDAAESLALLLELNGHEAHYVFDGESGIEKARQIRPDVVLSDIGLPDINGYEVATRIRSFEWGASPLLIATTGWGQDKDIARATGAGFDKHFTKPLDFPALKAYLHEYRLQNVN